MAVIIAPVVGWLGAMYAVELAGRAVAQCDIDMIAPSGALFFLVQPAAGLCNIAAFFFVFWGAHEWIARRVGPSQWQAAVGTGVAAFYLASIPVILMIWGVMGVMIPENDPSPICPDNVPPWWPSWLPV